MIYPDALLQFFTLISDSGGDIDKGALFTEPRILPGAEGAYERGQTAHILSALAIEPILTNPYRNSPDGERWARGRYNERQEERHIAAAYRTASLYMVLP